MVFRVRKYVPMGPTIMAAVNASSLYMIALRRMIYWVKFDLFAWSGHHVMIRHKETNFVRTYAGTAGLVSDFSEIPREISFDSSLSKKVFSLEIILREVML
jgi:hypothetical protein